MPSTKKNKPKATKASPAAMPMHTHYFHLAKLRQMGAEAYRAQSTAMVRGLVGYEGYCLAVLSESEDRFLAVFGKPMLTKSWGV